ncbi:protein kinase [Streptomyces sp. ML-6]|uniref:protein kinase domain-containing protein n=1 Tax=Streptomyces sp. ML-6 TaxID=2982693 RepID=UPI0024BFF5D9|nr:protein kinase [Streptomyces sp. ML-6]MDK0519220.1 protein kinase [Streptomyces sp. ML-6]
MWGRGTLINDRYALVGRLGSGAMGEVWRAEDQVLKREVAVKFLRPSGLEDNSFLPRFRKEAKVLASIRHPGVVGVHDYGEQTFPGNGDGHGTATQAAYIVMELVEGKTLEELREEHGLLPPARVLDLAAQALDALHTVHRLGIVHRDIKPSNLMLREDGRVTVTDFGIARTETGTRLTDPHGIIGTPRYMSPEQARGLPVLPASDLYSIGAVCYELITGIPMFRGASPLEVALKHIEEPVPALPDDVPEATRAFLAQALAKDPEDRYVNAAVMAAAARRAAKERNNTGERRTTGNRDAAEQRGTTDNRDAAEERGTAGKSDAHPRPHSRPRPRPRLRPVILLAALFVSAATATALYFAPPPWNSDADADSHSGPGSNSDPLPDSAAPAGDAKTNGPGAGWEDRGVIQPEKFPSTSTFWVVNINPEDPKAEFVAVDKDQTFRFWWNNGPSDTGWKPFSPGQNSYAPPAGAVGSALRFGDIDGDGFPDCMVVAPDGRLKVHTWKKENPSGARMCMNDYPGTPDVFSDGPTGEQPSVDPKSRIVFADVTGGGRDDYLLIEPDGTTTAWYNRDFQSTGGREYLDWAPPENIDGARTEPEEILYADIDGDRRADRILITAKGGARAWLNEGAEGAGGKFREIGRIAEDSGVPPQEVRFADVDGDGRADFLRIERNGVTHAWLNRLKPEQFGS